MMSSFWRMICRTVSVGVFAISVALSFAVQPAAAAEKIVVTGVLGSWTSGLWPFLIAQKKGFFSRHNIKHDIVFAPTAPGLVQQLTAGSIDMIALNGLAEPLHAVEKGAPVAIMRIMGQTTNYVMIGGKSVKSLADLKGKKVALGGLRDINKIYFDRVIANTGLKDSDVDIIVIGATGPRFAALQSGSIDATMLVPPFNFTAIKNGFNNLGLVRDFAPDLPQTGMQVSLRWAKANMKEAREINEAVDEAVSWFYDEKNRDEAIDILVEAAKADRKVISDSYDFLRGIEFFARTSAIHSKPLEAMMRDMVAIKDMSKMIPVASLVVPGLNEIVD